MKNSGFFFLVIITFLTACGGQGKKNETENNLAVDISLKLEVITEGLHSPVAAAFSPGGLMLVCEQTGQIRVIENNKLIEQAFLNLESKLVKMSGAYDERGLLGIALHPDYANNKKFYVYYSAPSTEKGLDHQSVIAEYKVSTDPRIADAASERIVLRIQQPESNHNGGDLKFGPDGYLYIGVGDGGGAGDRHGEAGNGQDLNTLLGKILRIDVNTDQNYVVPNDNPFVGKIAKPEIWAYGLRNPWRFSFDKNSGQLFVADVGQNKFEEVNIIEKGGNYGWRIMEAGHCFDPEENCKTEGLILPISEYEHEEGISITGGFMYRGKELAKFADKYIFADWTGPMFYLEKKGESWIRGTVSLAAKPSGDLKILSFAQDNGGELYVLTNQEVGPKNTKGAIYKLINP
jgi:glucose/arabinose dehydrogenase